MDSTCWNVQKWFLHSTFLVSSIIYRLHVWSPLLLHISIHDEWVLRRSVKSLFRPHITAVWCRQRWRLFVWRPPARTALCWVIALLPNICHLQAQKADGSSLRTSFYHIIFLPSTRQGRVRFTALQARFFICLKLVNTVKCTEPPHCSAAVLQSSVIIRCRDADTLQLNNFTVQLHLMGWFIYWASRTEKFLTRCKDYTHCGCKVDALQLCISTDCQLTRVGPMCTQLITILMWRLRMRRWHMQILSSSTDHYQVFAQIRGGSDNKW